MKTEVTLKGGDRTKAVLARIGTQVGKGGVVKVGFLATSRYPDGTYIAQVAFWNEFGTTRAPARPFFRGMIADKSPTWGKALSKNLKATNYNSERTLGLMGQGIADQLTESIVNWSQPPNADSTVARKGFNDPLIDTGEMQRAPDFVVETEGNGA